MFYGIIYNRTLQAITLLIFRNNRLFKSSAAFELVSVTTLDCTHRKEHKLCSIRQPRPPSQQQTAPESTQSVWLSFTNRHCVLFEVYQYRLKKSALYFGDKISLCFIQVWLKLLKKEMVLFYLRPQTSFSMQSRKTTLCLIPRKLHWKIIYLSSSTGNFRLGIHTTREISRIVIRLSIIAIGFYHLACLQHKPMGQVS